MTSLQSWARSRTHILWAVKSYLERAPTCMNYYELRMGDNEHRFCWLMLKYHIMFEERMNLLSGPSRIMRGGWLKPILLAHTKVIYLSYFKRRQMHAGSYKSCDGDNEHRLCWFLQKLDIYICTLRLYSNHEHHSLLLFRCESGSAISTFSSGYPIKSTCHLCCIETPTTLVKHDQSWEVLCGINDLLRCSWWNMGTWSRILLSRRRWWEQRTGSYWRIANLPTEDISWNLALQKFRHWDDKHQLRHKGIMVLKNVWADSLLSIELLSNHCFPFPILP